MTKEEKDKLIALSDLNREDNIKYISSEAQGIAIALDSDRYAPTFCKLERAYICGRRKSEEQIEKMKRCVMCKYHTSLGYCRIRQKGGVCENNDKWELQEND